MKGKGEVQVETAINSPTKRSSFDTARNHILQNDFASNFYISNSALKISETEIQMYSDVLIREVMQSSRQKSVWHDINRIQQNQVLYAKPLKAQENQLKFESIPSRNQMYASACSAKIKNIKEELAQNYRSYQQNVDNLKSKNKNLLKKRPSSASAKIDTRKPNINVTGLVSYNFSSANARNTLGFNKVNREEKLIKAIQENDQRRFCSSQREGRILAKSSGRRFIKYAQNQKAIMSDFVSDTDSYLKDVIRRKEQSILIYNENSKKLNLIKEYMQQQKVIFDEASHIVNEIDQSNKIKKMKQKPVKPKLELNDERSFSNRRMPVQYKPLMVKQYAFIE